MRLWNFINIILLLTLFCKSKISSEVRQSALAGRWYSANSSKLASTIDDLITDIDRKKTLSNPLLLILPHAGYIYSGSVAARGYDLVKRLSPEIIVIIAPSHYSHFHGCSILPVDFYETPLGRVRVAKSIVNKLLYGPLFQTNRAAHRQEHSIEIHIPFLQRIYRDRLRSDIEIIPILVGNITRDDSVKISSSIVRAIKDKRRPLIIVSSDFTHYGDRFDYLPFRSNNQDILRKKIRDLDFGAVKHIINKDLDNFCSYVNKTGITACGRNAIKIALALPIRDFKAEVISYDTSGNITGDYNNSVSYVSICYSGTILKGNEEGQIIKNEDFQLTDKDKRYLLYIARKNIESVLHKNKNLEIQSDNVPKNCRNETGVFVTLKKKGNLRGCIGYVLGIKPLNKAVIENSYNAAFRDPRFSPLDKAEFNDIEIEISVLTKPQIVESIDEIKVGRDGLIIEKGHRKGLLLPQVPVEWNWNREEFLIHTCRKSGLPDYAWKYGAQIYRFQAIVFSEGDL
ncbi:MAG: AmmeMemoRadiSam system protein B [Spirochaetota bacterium]|nr:AmmeMemoRadiSam system protein B [Spirochaetota bacterium]